MMDAPTNYHPRKVEEALSTIIGDGNVCEIRVLGVEGRKRTDSGYFDDFEKAAKAVGHYANDSKTKGIYVVLNPIPADLMARASNRMQPYASNTTSDKDVLRRKWLLVDCDPVRASGISASNDESLAAMEKAEEVRTWLMKQGCHEPVYSMSGNGYHLLIPIDLPNDDESQTLIKTVLEALAERFNDNSVTVDTSVHNAARICRLYGTRAQKGDSTADRPHRRSEIRHKQVFAAYALLDLTYKETNRRLRQIGKGPKDSREALYWTPELFARYTNLAWQRFLNGAINVLVEIASMAEKAKGPLAGIAAALGVGVGAQKGLNDLKNANLQPQEFVQFKMPELSNETKGVLADVTDAVNMAREERIRGRRERDAMFNAPKMQFNVEVPGAPPAGGTTTESKEQKFHGVEQRNSAEAFETVVRAMQQNSSPEMKEAKKTNKLLAEQNRLMRQNQPALRLQVAGPV